MKRNRKQDGVFMRTAAGLEQKHAFGKNRSRQQRDIERMNEYVRYSESKVREYSPPEISELQLFRCDFAGTENADGGYIKAVFSAAVSKVFDGNTAKYRLQIEHGCGIDQIELSELDGIFEVNGFEYIFAAENADHAVILTVSDSYRSAQASALIIFDGWRELELGYGYENTSGAGDIPLRHRRNSCGLCEIVGNISAVSDGAETIATLPEGFRPRSKACAVCFEDGAAVGITINSDGVISPNITPAVGARIEIYACFPSE